MSFCQGMSYAWNRNRNPHACLCLDFRFQLLETNADRRRRETTYVTLPTTNAADFAARSHLSRDPKVKNIRVTYVQIHLFFPLFFFLKELPPPPTSIRNEILPLQGNVTYPQQKKKGVQSHDDPCVHVCADADATLHKTVPCPCSNSNSFCEERKRVVCLRHRCGGSLNIPLDAADPVKKKVVMASN